MNMTDQSNQLRPNLFNLGAYNSQNGSNWSQVQNNASSFINMCEGFQPQCQVQAPFANFPYYSNTFNPFGNINPFPNTPAMSTFNQNGPSVSNPGSVNHFETSAFVDRTSLINPLAESSTLENCSNFLNPSTITNPTNMINSPNIINSPSIESPSSILNSSTSCFVNSSPFLNTSGPLNSTNTGGSSNPVIPQGNFALQEMDTGARTQSLDFKSVQLPFRCKRKVESPP